MGDLVKLLPPEFREVALLAKFGIEAAMKMVGQVSEYLSDVRGGLVAGGGGAGTSAAVNAISKGLGSDIGGAGANLMNGMAPAYAAQAGVNPLGGPFGDIDYNKKVIRLLELISRQKDFTQARRVAEGLGSPELAKFYLLTKLTQKQLLDSQQTGPGMGAISAQADLQAQLALTTKNFMDMASVLAGPMFISMSNTLSLINKIWEIQNKYGVISGIKDGLDWVQKALGGPDDDHKNAVKDNTDAINNLNKSINQGTFGGGPRAQGAIPKAQRQAGYYAVNPYTPLGVL
jgi:hypothetical protein